MNKEKIKQILARVGLIFFMGFVLVFLVEVSLIFAAPAQWGIAINAENKTCANYWAGDEFTFYPLPAGWEAYYPEFVNSGDARRQAYENIMFKTKIGNCTDKININNDFSACCSQLGYTFVSNLNPSSEDGSAKVRLSGDVIVSAVSRKGF